MSHRRHEGHWLTKFEIIWTRRALAISEEMEAAKLRDEILPRQQRRDDPTA